MSHHEKIFKRKKGFSSSWWANFLRLSVYLTLFLLLIDYCCFLDGGALFSLLLFHSPAWLSAFFLHLMAFGISTSIFYVVFAILISALITSLFVNRGNFLTDLRRYNRDTNKPIKFFAKIQWMLAASALGCFAYIIFPWLMPAAAAIIITTILFTVAAVFAHLFPKPNSNGRLEKFSSGTVILGMLLLVADCLLPAMHLLFSTIPATPLFALLGPWSIIPAILIFLTPTMLGINLLINNPKTNIIIKGISITLISAYMGFGTYLGIYATGAPFFLPIAIGAIVFVGLLFAGSWFNKNFLKASNHISTETTNSLLLEKEKYIFPEKLYLLTHGLDQNNKGYINAIRYCRNRLNHMSPSSEQIKTINSLSEYGENNITLDQLLNGGAKQLLISKRQEANRKSNVIDKQYQKCGSAPKR